MFISPMLLHKSENPFDDDSYITELKLDGFRTIWTKFHNRVRIYTRHNNEITSMFPELVGLPLPDGTVLDGEIIVTDHEGRPDFEAVMERFKSKKSEHKISFSVFDMIYCNNIKATSLPLIERKGLLEKIITEDTPLLNKVKWVEGAGIQYFDLIKQHDLEGIVQKKANSKYQINKRSQDWLKVINYKYDNVYISGLRKDTFGLLLSFEDGKYAGVMEFMTPQNRKEFYIKYKDFITEENDKYIYLGNQLKAKVKYRNLTKKGLLRIPSFVEWI
ncbi:ATP-dependent DNA ligase [Psychrobacillus sp. FJAT-51614]|uniref:ATP-dependent DNA ligase n=1 Tax=Psychrobacillus mangrovi TaxID=3117745 RepID=A0ABU8FA97_9BACI